MNVTNTVEVYRSAMIVNGLRSVTGLTPKIRGIIDVKIHGSIS